MKERVEFWKNKLNECLQEIIESAEIKLPKKLEEIAKGIKEDNNLTEKKKKSLDGL